MGTKRKGRSDEAPAAEETRPLQTVEEAIDQTVAQHLDALMVSLRDGGSDSGSPPQEGAEAESDANEPESGEAEAGEATTASAATAATAEPDDETEAAAEAPEPEAEPEPETAGDAEAEAPDDSEAGEGLGPLPDRTKRRVQERINALTRQAAEARERVEQLERELRLAREPEREPGQGKAGAAPGAGVLDDCRTDSEVERRVDEAWRVKEWCDEHADGATVPDGKGGEREINPEQVRTMRRRADQTILRDAPRRREYLREEAQWNRAAEQEFSWLADPKSQAAQMIGAVLEAFPELRSRPSWRFAAATYVHGALDLQARRAAKQKAKPGNGAPPPKQPGAPRTAPGPRATARSQVTRGLRERAMRSGAERDVVEYLKGAQLI